MFKLVNYSLFALLFSSFYVYGANQETILEKLQSVKNMIENGHFSAEEKAQSVILIKEIGRSLLLKNPNIPVPSTILTKKEEKSNVNDFSISPSSKNISHAIYVHQLNNFKIDSNDRINFLDLYKELINKDHKDEDEIKLDDNERFTIMAEVEKRFIMMLNKYSNLILSQYVGESSRDLYTRFREHQKDIKKNKSQKAKSHNNTLSHKALKMTHIISDLPEAELKNFEVLIGNIVPSNLFFANTKLGDDAAWKAYNNYENSDKRKEKITEEDKSYIKKLINDITSSILNSVKPEQRQVINVAVKRKLFKEEKKEEEPETKKKKTE